MTRKITSLRNKASRKIKKQVKKMGQYNNTIISVVIGDEVQRDVMAMENPISYLKSIGIVE